MATNITLNNRTDRTLRLVTEPMTDNWEPGTWKVLATEAPPHRETPFLNLNRDEGIRNGKLYLMGTSVEDDAEGHLCNLEEKLGGLAVGGSDIWAKIAGPKGKADTGWVADGTATLRFVLDGKKYQVRLRWTPTSWFDDLVYTIMSSDG